nr:hypothetical protein [Nocardioides daphniae]
MGEQVGGRGDAERHDHVVGRQRPVGQAQRPHDPSEASTPSTVACSTTSTPALRRPATTTALISGAKLLSTRDLVTRVTSRPRRTAASAISTPM